MIPLQSVTAKAFAPFGNVIEFPTDCTEDFYIVEDEKANWRLAVYKYTAKEIIKIEQHPTSKESFEPLDGITVLVVAPPQDPSQLQAFVLDKPICLDKGVWHQVLSLTPSASVKITENSDVYSVYHDLSSPLQVVLDTVK